MDGDVMVDLKFGEKADRTGHTGLKVIGAVDFFFGIVLLLSGLLIFGFSIQLGASLFRSSAILSVFALPVAVIGIIYILFGVFYTILGIELIREKKWAYRAEYYLTLLAILLGIILLMPMFTVVNLLVFLYLWHIGYEVDKKWCTSGMFKNKCRLPDIKTR